MASQQNVNLLERVLVPLPYLGTTIDGICCVFEL